jgi:hypothetical protein
LECLHQLVIKNIIFRKAPPSVVSGYGKRSINLNKIVANFEKHIFLSQTIWYRHPNSETGNDEIENFQRKDFYFVGITF